MPHGAPLGAFLYTILQVNSPGLKEMLGMSFEAVLEEFGLTAKWEAKGLEKGMERATKRLRNYGMEPQQIAEALVLPLGTVFTYLKAE
jgi:hypothetical protein